MWNFIMQILYNPILALVKCSVLVLLHRIAGHSNTVWWSIVAIAAFTVVQGAATFLVVIFQCSPIQYFWLRYDPDSDLNGTCINSSAFYVATAAFTIFTDVLVLALPFFIFLGVKMDGRTKWMVIGLFLLGGM